MNCLSSPALYDTLTNKGNVTVTDMMDMCDAEDQLHDTFQSQPIDASESASNDAEDPLSKLNSLSQAASDAKNVTKDQELINALRIVEERISALKYAHDDSTME